MSETKEVQAAPVEQEQLDGKAANGEQKKKKKSKKEKKKKSEAKSAKSEQQSESGSKSEDEIIAEIPGVIRKLRKTFASGRTKDISWRRENLDKIKTLVHENEPAILEALKADLGRSKTESVLAEIAFILGEVDSALSNIWDWTKDVRVATPFSQMKGLTTSLIHKEPLGVVLVISPWNYPFSLCLDPLIGAISAGNCVIIKPSEISIHTSALLAKLIPKYLDSSAIQVIEGGVNVSRAILSHPFDHIFFTGSTAVGKVVMKAAAEHLTPVTLELGGKSPCIIDSEVDLDVAVRRTVWGKFWNAGQTCIAPDYLLVHSKVYDTFISKLRSVMEDFYGKDPKESEDYARIVSDRHVERLGKMIDEVKQSKKSEVLIGGEVDKETRFIAPTVLNIGSLSGWMKRSQSPESEKDKEDDVEKGEKGKEKETETEKLGVMEEEIFGPILPVLKYKSLKRVVSYINSRPKPLALYMFSKNSENKDYLLENTSSGGLLFNDVLLHYTNPNLPFGGVGESGMGRYHGKLSFDTFSHQRAVVDKTTRFDISVRYPPYDDKKLNQLRKMSNW